MISDFLLKFDFVYMNTPIAALKNMFTKAADWNMVNEATSKQIHKVKMFKENNK